MDYEALEAMERLIVRAKNSTQVWVVSGEPVDHIDVIWDVDDEYYVGQMPVYAEWQE